MDKSHSDCTRAESSCDTKTWWLSPVDEVQWLNWLMTGSGIEECFKIIFPNFPVDKLLTGKSHYKTVRGHLLIDAAFVVYGMEGVLSNQELADVHDHIDNLKESKEGAYKETEIMKNISRLMEEKFESLKQSGKTQQLWVQYHEQV